MKKKVLSIILAVVMIAGMIPLGTMTVFADSEVLRIAHGAPNEQILLMSAFGDSKTKVNIDPNIQIKLLHYKNNLPTTEEHKAFYVGELIKAEVSAKEGELPDGLFYAWLMTDQNGSKIYLNGAGNIAGFENPDTYIDETEYYCSPDALYGAVKVSAVGSSAQGTAYCKFAVCKRDDGATTILAYENFTASCVSKNPSDYYSFDNERKFTAGESWVTMTVGESCTILELLGRSGITHITCPATSSTERFLFGTDNPDDGNSIKSQQSAQRVTIGSKSYTKNFFTITANSVVRDFGIYFDIGPTGKETLCTYHHLGECENALMHINVIEEPDIVVNCTDIILNNPEKDYDYFIGQQKGEVIDGKVYFGGLTPETEYIVRMQITGENGEATYPYAVKVKTKAHDFSDIRDNGDGTHSTYCLYGCGGCFDTAEHIFDDGECTVCHATEHTIPETTYTIVIPKEVAVNSKGITAIGKPTVKDVENADGKIITYTAEGTDFTKSDDNSKIVKAAYYTAYTDADNNTPLGTESITVYDGGYIAEESLTALYVFISDEEWENAENGTYHATVTYNFEAKEE